MKEAQLTETLTIEEPHLEVMGTYTSPHKFFPASISAITIKTAERLRKIPNILIIIPKYISLEDSFLFFLS